MNGSAQESKASRCVTACIGVAFVLIAIAIPLSSPSDPTLGPLAAALVVAGVGLEALFSAIRGRRSLLSRIGPLP